MENKITYRNQRIPIQVTEDEKRKLQAAALKTGLPVSTYIRVKMLEMVDA